MDGTTFPYFWEEVGSGFGSWSVCDFWETGLFLDPGGLFFCFFTSFSAQLGHGNNDITSGNEILNTSFLWQSVF